MKNIGKSIVGAPNEEQARSTYKIDKRIEKIRDIGLKTILRGQTKGETRNVAN